jgi:hypothetical protein
MLENANQHEGLLRGDLILNDYESLVDPGIAIES